MKYTQAITIISAVAGFTSAAPAAESRQFKALITFTGAAASYTLEVPTDASVFYTSKSRKLHTDSPPFCVILMLTCDQDNNLAVDTISSEGGASCGFTGADGAAVNIVGHNSVTVGPPQAIVSGSCLAL